MEASKLISIVSLQLMSFVVYALIGVYAIKRKVINKDGLGVLSAFIIRIALPIMIFTNTINGATREQFFKSLPVLGVSALMFFSLFVLGNILSRFFTLDYNRKHVYRACVMFGNVGFMGIPLLIALLPERGMLYMALFTIIDQLCLWTIGLSLCTPETATSNMTTRDKLMKLLNPPNVAIIFATILVLLEVKLPPFLNTALMKVGNSTPPLALAYLGGLFALMNIKEHLGRVEVYAAVIVKMIAFPILFNHLLHMIPGLHPEIILTLTILSAVPSMSSIPMVAQSQGSAGEYAAGMVFVTALCFLGTLPLVCLFIK